MALQSPELGRMFDFEVARTHGGADVCGQLLHPPAVFLAQTTQRQGQAVSSPGQCLSSPMGWLQWGGRGAWHTASCRVAPNKCWLLAVVCFNPRDLHVIKWLPRSH